jgi:hypothetical protein
MYVTAVRWGLLGAANFLLFGANRLPSAAVQSTVLEMVRRVKVPTKEAFLTADGVATRLAIRALKKAKIDPGPLLAKAGISWGGAETRWCRKPDPFPGDCSGGTR